MYNIIREILWYVLFIDITMTRFITLQYLEFKLMYLDGITYFSLEFIKDDI